MDARGEARTGGGGGESSLGFCLAFLKIEENRCHGNNLLPPLTEIRR
jgi:hypothetical protein